MSKTAEAVSSFLSELCTKLRPLGDADLAEMLHLKEDEVHCMLAIGDTTIFILYFQKFTNSYYKLFSGFLRIHVLIFYYL